MSCEGGGRYRIGSGGEYIVVDAIDEITLEEITEALATETGFDSTEDLMTVARHGDGRLVFLIRFHYVDGNILDA